MAEWSIAAVLKTVEPQGSGGSNPSLSAKLGGVSRIEALVVPTHNIALMVNAPSF